MHSCLDLWFSVSFLITHSLSLYPRKIYWRRKKQLLAQKKLHTIIAFLCWWFEFYGNRCCARNGESYREKLDFCELIDRTLWQMLWANDSDIFPSLLMPTITFPHNHLIFCLASIFHDFLRGLVTGTNIKEKTSNIFINCKSNLLLRKKYISIFFNNATRYFFSNSSTSTTKFSL